jgi:hypothetical protein
VDRVASLISSSRQEGVPSLLVVSGSLFARREAGDLRGRAQHAQQAEVLVDVLNSLGDTVLLPDRADMRDYARPLTGLEARSSLLPPAASRGLTLRVGSRRLGFLNLLDVEASAQSQAVRDLRSAGADLVLVSTRDALPPDIAAAVDVVLVSAHDGAPPRASLLGSHPLEVHGGAHAEGLWVLDLWLPNGRSEDASWQLVTDFPRALAADRRAAWVRYRELPQSSRQAPEVRAQLERFFRDLTFLHAAEPDLGSGASESIDYAGSQTCAACHTGAYFWWLESPYGNAYAALERRHRQSDVDCLPSTPPATRSPGAPGRAISGS